MTRRYLVAALGTVAVASIAATAIWKHTPLLIWNVSASVPIGLYAVRAAGELTPGQLVVAMPPQTLAQFLANGRYLPKGLPLIKHVAALAESVVCRAGSTVSIDGVARAVARGQDYAGRPLPIWDGCRTIGVREVFLLNESEPSSFDGRYFGPLPSSSIVGEAVPIWTEQPS